MIDKGGTIQHEEETKGGGGGGGKKKAQKVHVTYAIKATTKKKTIVLLNDT